MGEPRRGGENLVKGSDLQLRDVVGLPGGGPYTCCTVVFRSSERLTLFRPYVATSDFDFNNRVIPYVGIETWDAPITSEYVLFGREKGVPVAKQYDHFHATVVMVNTEVVEIEGGWVGYPKEWDTMHDGQRSDWLKRFCGLWAQGPVAHVKSFSLAG